MPVSGFKVESGVPIPEKKTNTPGPVVLALRELAQAQCGDSIFIPGKEAKRIGPFILNAAGKGWALSRQVEGGVRVWKIAEPKVPAQ